ncbi:response regulator [Emticicia sp. BO119]|uniref:response regulator n=1 Tax=Emticicia sp. BO119 TaxID=2757768 RepID=UPI0015F0A850|nr:response regulator [Emticicia sp. BO119]MBA4849172.1 response regulator [Emticicia sp. BO119]
MKARPIILIEDDADDKDILEEVITELKLPNSVIWFKNCIDAMQYLQTTEDQPFIIVCDINLPLQNGMEFKRQIDGNLEMRRRSIPFVFYSTSDSQKLVNEAYMQFTVQGFFKKEYDFEKIKSHMRIMMEYWAVCRHPNT